MKFSTITRVASLILAYGFMSLFFSTNANATSQFARKYQVSCTTCHTAFPRLTAFGEDFKRNGYQWPGDAPDGAKKGKIALADDLAIDQVGEWLGARLSLTPLKNTTNKRTVNGGTESQFDVGNSNWVQFFVAGSITKNVSIFIENEFEKGGMKFNWYYLNFTNLYGTYVNFQTGNLSPVDFTSYSDRLRMWGKSAVLNLNASGGNGESSANVRAPRPGIQYYGYTGPLMWFAGIDNGKDSSSTTNDKNYWAGLKVTMPYSVSHALDGSSMSYHYYTGVDTADTATNQKTNNFNRHTLAANIRYQSLDVQAVYQYGTDDNYALTATDVKKTFSGETIVAAYSTPTLYYVLQYDRIDSTDIPTIEVSKVSPSIWYFVAANFKAGLTGTVDLLSNDANHKQQHSASLEIRAMF